MKIVEEQKFVPAKSYIVKKYIASDGEEFNFENECLVYENNLRVMSHPVFSSCIKDVNTFYEEIPAILYYISSQEDFEFLVGEKRLHYLTSDFNEHGAGWYIYYSESGGDYPDSNYLYNLISFVEKLESEVKEWKSNIFKKLGW